MKTEVSPCRNCDGRGYTYKYSTVSGSKVCEKVTCKPCMGTGMQ
ncbi:hypothetical protein ABZ801_15975 [Actinomadura sp. NPDC047616]